MMNYKCKSHRGRSLENRTDALTICEIGDKILRVFAVTITDKKSSTIILIMLKRVTRGASISTDEAKV